MKFVFGSKTNKDLSTEIFPPILLKPPYNSCAIESQKQVSNTQTGSIFMKTTVLYTSRNIFLLYALTSGGCAMRMGLMQVAPVILPRRVATPKC